MRNYVDAAKASRIVNNSAPRFFVTTDRDNQGRIYIVRDAHTYEYGRKAVASFRYREQAEFYCNRKNAV